MWEQVEFLQLSMVGGRVRGCPRSFGVAGMPCAGEKEPGRGWDCPGSFGEQGELVQVNRGLGGQGPAQDLSRPGTGVSR